MRLVIDTETDGLLDSVTKVHCVSYKDIDSDGDPQSALTYDAMREVLESATTLVCHNIFGYDLRVWKKLLGFTPSPKVKLYDSLALSWVLFHDRDLHGLASWGESFGIPKPPINDWSTLTPEEYSHRCQEDVKINVKLWDHIQKKLKLLYGGNPEGVSEATRYMDYISFKMSCAAHQEDVGWHLDVKAVEKHLATLEGLQGPKLEELKSVMPLRKIYKVKKKPKVLYRKDGSLSVAGEEWFKALSEENLKEDTLEFKVVDRLEAPNPNSSEQVKDWLFGLGWEPCTFDYKKNSEGVERAIPQVRKDGELTESVKILSEKEPHVKVLEDLTIIEHRKAIFKGFLDSVTPEDQLRATISGFTNTLRFKHSKPLVNLPGVDKPWGREVRGSLLAPPGGLLCGSDMVSLESTTKRHYMFPYDPKYVEEMSQDGFDEHLDLAKHAGELSGEDYKFYTKGNHSEDPDKHKRIHKVRKKFKPANYSCVYGVGAPKLSRTTGLTQREAQKLIDAYWSRNWAVKKLVEPLEVKMVGKQKWLKNPVSGFWYSLRADKDKFSTLNQSTGVYCFDTWLAYCRTKGVDICGQFHDEQANPIVATSHGCDSLEEAKKKHIEVLKWAIQKTNDKLKLNIKLDVDIKFGLNYAEVH